MQKTVIIVAGGSGSRMKTELPKQFLKIGGKVVLMHTILRFIEYDSSIKIRLVLPENQISYWLEVCKEYEFNIQHEIFSGGITRFHSVKNGLNELSNDGLVAIHDGVRPFVSVDTIRRCFLGAEEYGAAIPVIDVYEILRKTDGDYSYTVDRNSFKLVQTPQVFESRFILEAYNRNFDETFTDDASVFESTGKLVMLVEGNRENIKITAPADLILAEAYLKA
jgi:2-C-methyl-D-erythritol 4-phosphate cytidylyltransferase